MKRRLILGTVLAMSLAFIVSVACVAPAFAGMTYYDHMNVGVKTVIDIACHQPRFLIIVGHFDGGDHGVGDWLDIEMWTHVVIPPIVDEWMWTSVAIVTDSPSIADFQKNVLWAGLPTANNVRLVKSCELQVCKMGKTVLAYWTVPIVSPAVTLPPGCLLFKGYGCAHPEQLVFPLPTGVTLTIDMAKVFAAHATFVCPAWKYCGPVGDEGTCIEIDCDWWVTLEDT
jgi:hypothetical protein